MSGSLSDSLSPPDTTVASDKPYHSKRPHKKSRAGCKNCKARKVKCDEARPICRSCKLRKNECVYPDIPEPASAAASSKPRSAPDSVDNAPTSSASPSSAFEEWCNGGGHSHTPAQSNALVRASTASSTTPHVTDACPPELKNDLQLLREPLFRPAVARDDFDMRLLWFYTTATCSSFSIEYAADRPVETIMRTRIVHHAFQTPFLMQSLFALAALHLQNLNQEIDPKRALAYRATSFEGYRKAVAEADPETFPAMITNSLILTALSSQAFRDADGKDLYIVDWMIVWRGIGLIIQTMGFERFLASGLQTLFYRPPMDLDDAAKHIPNTLLYMVSSIPESDPDFQETQTYYDTLKYLGALYQNLHDGGLGPIMVLRIITWFTFIPNGFVELGRQRRPRALVIIAFYAAFLKLANSVWWIKGIGQRTLRDVCRHLGPEWSYVLNMPMHAINTEDREDLVRLILADPEWLSADKPATEDPLAAAVDEHPTWTVFLGKEVDLSCNFELHAPDGELMP
ncbi:uncharacterized protein F5Z01DRAFT_419990 [Emericellopsis atlantica]|uniref:Zn(2)-C6 fungal-type domain-containing protein n=1 Tax=Emericellopsis atlantica TaxID=2614577 RepID=A0A9P8CKR6_9HYPO|nr:uncharacterized protein F5Z01DRAFT_419990 [Emericellopsis atlantica]KAG9250230.1 hypothetical protein F5Z01DRAFT_419990 [Emericellopsis atlantica]